VKAQQERREKKTGSSFGCKLISDLGILPWNMHSEKVEDHPFLVPFLGRNCLTVRKK